MAAESPSFEVTVWWVDDDGRAHVTERHRHEPRRDAVWWRHEFRRRLQS